MKIDLRAASLLIVLVLGGLLGENGRATSHIVVVDFGTLGGSDSSAETVNETGQVAGWSSTADNAAGHATLWEIATLTLPSTPNDCRNGGWRTYGVFKNQGDCVSFVATRGKNPPG